MFGKRTSPFVIGLAVAWAITSPMAATAADFTGKRIDMIVPFSAGGSTSAYSQFMANMLKKHLPGNPTVLVRNVPGGGAVTGINEFVRRAKPDGLTIATPGTSSLMNYALGNSAIRYNLDDFEPLIASPAGVTVYIKPSLGVTGASDFKNLRDRTITFGGNSPTASDLPVLLSLDMLGLKLNPVFGLEGSGPRRQAFQRGEFDINFDTSPSFHDEVLPLIQSGAAVPLFTFGVLDAKGDIVRDPVVPDLPTFIEFYEAVQGAPPSGPAFEAWKTVFAARVMAGKVVVLPAGTPPDISETYHKAMEAIVNDPDFKGEQALEIVGPYPQPLREAAAVSIHQAGTLSPEVKTWLLAWLKKNYDVTP